jgi:hypothetical protein
VVAAVGARGAELVGELEGRKHSYRLGYVRGPDSSLKTLMLELEP